MNSESFINAILSGNRDEAVEAFNSSLSAKVADALEVKKVEVASNFIAAPTEMNTEAQTEA